MDIREGFVPGALGQIVALHGAHYAKNWGFGTVFEAKVAQEIAEFAGRKTSDDLVLLAVDEAGVAASLIVDLHDPQSGARGAHLRWFIAHERCRGRGVGREMLARACAHADAHSGGGMWLTTFRGLHAARHLYETHGFELAQEAEGAAWGTVVTEQEFRRPLRV